MYILFALILFFSFMVITSRNVIYSLACLISTFVFSALLLLLIHLEFLGYILIVVYVGAIAILFLFVIMTLDVSREELTASIVRNSGGYYSHVTGFAFSALVLWSVWKVVHPLSALFDRFNFIFDAWSLFIENNGTHAISVSLYTYNVPFLFVAGLLLLIAMVGAVILTLKPARPTQNSSKQSYRKTSSAVTRSKTK